MESITEISQYFDLGKVKPEVTQVTGGLMHKMWKVQAGSGIFAIKQLNPEVISRPKARQDYLDSEKVAQIMKDRGIPSVPALVVNNSPLFENEQGTFMVFPWVEGKILVGEPTPNQIFRVGEILGKIHSLKLTDETKEVPAYEETSSINWSGLITQAEKNHLVWSKISDDMKDKLVDLATSHPDIMRDLNQRRIISHKDMDKKNILWREDGSLIVIDWESAGPINSGVDLIGTALDWSGLHEEKIDKSMVENFLKGYKSTGGNFTEDPKIVLEAIAGNWLEWLAYNMRRSIQENRFPEDEQKVAIIEVSKVLAIINNLDKNIELYSKWF
ncbi:MAG: phosphotransferase [Candidatus Daviesbacteria bacterium]|nr:phosphotransferase [Candidatus Daviesbacteria bacterium]